MTSAAIIGAGELGGAVAHALATRRSVGRVILVDPSESAARGKALDIQQSGAISGFDTRLEGTADPARALGCQVAIVADRFGNPSSEWTGPGSVREMGTLARSLGAAPLVFAGASQTGLMLEVAREGGVSPNRLLGSSPEAFGSAVRAIVALEARCAPAEVMVSVLGAPPAFVVPWSTASIGGYALDQVLTPARFARVEARVRSLWPPQSYALGMAAALVAEGVVRTARRAFDVLTVLDGEFGARGQIGALPSLLSTTGVVARRLPSLTARERVLVETALGAP